jgi:zinc D-Ala-D-Ala carboxypeptidase
MKLTSNFTLEEMCASQVATRNRIDNRPNAAQVENLRRLATMLETIRLMVGKPVRVSSGYRSPALNRAIGGSARSAHMDGLAADITVPGMTARELALRIRDAHIDFDQLIHEGTWVHVGLRSGKQQRRQVLTALFSPVGVTYAEGIT